MCSTSPTTTERSRSISRPTLRRARSMVSAAIARLGGADPEETGRFTWVGFEFAVAWTGSIGAITAAAVSAFNGPYWV